MFIKFMTPTLTFIKNDEDEGDFCVKRCSVIFIKLKFNPNL